MSPLVKFTRPHSEKQMSQFLEDLSVEQFKESEREAAENDSISVQIFIYLTHKSTITSNDNTLKEMNEFLYSMQGSESPGYLIYTTWSYLMKMLTLKRQCCISLITVRITFSVSRWVGVVGSGWQNI